jgi:hypothetical protein
MVEWTFKNASIEMIKEKLSSNENPIVQLKLWTFLNQKEEITGRIQKYQSKFKAIVERLKQNEIFTDQIQSLQSKVSIMLRKSILSSSENPNFEIFFKEFQSNPTLKTFLELKELLGETTGSKIFLKLLTDHIWSLYSSNNKMVPTVTIVSQIMEHLEILIIENELIKANLITWSFSSNVPDDSKTIILFETLLNLFVTHRKSVTDFIKNWEASCAILLHRNAFEQRFVPIIHTAFKLSVELGFLIAHKKLDSMKHKFTASQYPQVIYFLRVLNGYYQTHKNKILWETLIASLCHLWKSKTKFVQTVKNDPQLQFQNKPKVSQDVIEIL